MLQFGQKRKSSEKTVKVERNYPCKIARECSCFLYEAPFSTLRSILFSTKDKTSYPCIYMELSFWSFVALNVTLLSCCCLLLL